jgi:Alginate lyase
MNKKYLVFVYFLIQNVQILAQNTHSEAFRQVSLFLEKDILQRANETLKLKPITVTAESCERSAGGKHDFYSEGDYWWQNPDDPNGPYIQRDGQSNPNNFTAHRKAMVRFSQIIGSLSSAYILTKDEKYIKASMPHLKAWFVDTSTRMNPSLLYAQAIKGKATGRGIGVIDMIQMIEVAQGVRVMEKSKNFDKENLVKIKKWFADYLTWVTTHKYGLEEREAKNNHGTCWVMQVGVFAKLTDNQQLISFCTERFKNIILPNQMADDGSLPLELARTKPYGYALFNLDAMTTICQTLSTKEDNLWDFVSANGRKIKMGIDFMYPFIEDKSKWKFPKDVMYWDELPIAQPSLIFGYQKYPDKKDWLITWKRLNHFPNVEEVIRNLPVRNPIIWLSYP